MTDIYLVGVGGQGIITASRIIGEAAIQSGLNVVLSETHGMAQRGGSVVCTARIGEVSGPLITDGKADVILSFELLETLRAKCKASGETIVITSTETWIPLSVSTQKADYPSIEDVRTQMNSISRGILLIDSKRMAEEAGVPISSNVVMIGALAGAGATEIDRDNFEAAIERIIPRKIEENREAFTNGYEEAKRALQ
ncbi:MAG: indolepyruvate oxidoreductase subunit beta [Methanobacteriota archaeon]|nr:MAG: indolepyruvate oxidoreductase subunit beta [Euryarchaeota archaeon]